MYAHIRFDDYGREINQTVEAHCRKAANYARQRLEKVGLGESAYLAALIHDLGKGSQAFQEYLRRSARGEAMRRGMVNHSSAALRLMLERYHNSEFRMMEDVAAELVAYAAGAHHGLFDCVDAEKQNGFTRRRKLDDGEYRQALSAFAAGCAGMEELDERWNRAKQELLPLLGRMQDLEEGGDGICFHIGMLARMLLSAVIDGDRRDSAEFMDGEVGSEKEPDLHEFWGMRLKFMETKLAQLPKERPIDRVRGEISQECRNAALATGGIYRLTVPTGGGKTLSVLRFALAHAFEQGKAHIFFIMPLLSIIEQNAACIREYIGDDGAILEHHSNVVREKTEGDKMDPRELLALNWDAPIVITTLVQFLNTLFQGRTSCIRRMQALCNSVIVIDEVQSVPIRMLSQFNQALNFLAEFCGATVVLCSATQPCLESVPHPLFHVREMIEEDLTRNPVLKRTKIMDHGTMRTEELAQEVRRLLEQHRSLLVICNTKRMARELYHRVGTKDVTCFYLSADMCPAHRSAVFGRMKAILDDKGRRVLCVATQVMEAGVDVSFNCVVRLSAGMDNVVQAAGRANRNGEDGTAPVYIVRCPDENLENLEEISKAKKALNELLEAYRSDARAFGEDLASAESIAYFYDRLYGEHLNKAMDYPLPKKKFGDGVFLYDLLGTNGRFAQFAKDRGRYAMEQAFKMAGETFSVFDKETVDVIVPYERGREIIAALQSERVRRNRKEAVKWINEARLYSVSTYQQEPAGAQYIQELGVWLLAEGYYDEETGLNGNAVGLSYWR